MPATPITNPFPGEDLLGVEPQFQQQVDPGWRHRLALFTGRALSDTALDGEQAYRAGLLATLGQAVSPGVVKGLVASFDISGTATVTTAAVASGNNVSLPVANSTGFQSGQPALLDSGANQEQFKVTAIPDATHIIAATIAKAHASGVTVQFEPLMNAAAGTGATTKTTAATTAGNNVSLPVSDSTGFQTGQVALIDANPNQEQFTVVSIPDATHIIADVLVKTHVSGVVVSFEPVLSVAAGYGISASGEDVYLLRDLKTKLSTLAVVDPVTGKAQRMTPTGGQPRDVTVADLPNLPGNNSPAGIVLLQPVVAQATGTTLDTGASPLIVSGNLNASCDQDPDENAFADLQIVDAARLVFVSWPASLTLPAPTPPATWRNRLVYTIFNAEAALAPDDQLPWAMLGVPIALAAFDSSWKPIFLDCGAVVRSGGLPRRNYVVPIGADESPAVVRLEILQARITQFAEQLSESLNGAPPLNNLSDILTTAPPSGVVPAAALDFAGKKNRWFPPNWALTAGPVHLEELETTFQTGIMASPIPVQATAPADKTQLEAVEVLVPLPDELYDPAILLTETVSGEFQAEIDLATNARNTTLKKRKALQLEANTLLSALGPNVPAPNPNLIHLNADLTPDEIGGRDAPLPYFPVSSSDPARDESFGVSGPTTWHPNMAYVVGQFIVDPNRNLQIVQKAGMSGPTQPTWNVGFSATTPEQATTTAVTAAVAVGSNVPIPVSSSSGFQPGQQLLIDTGANQEPFTVTAVPSPTQIIADKLAKAHAAGVIVSSNAVAWVNNGPVTLASMAWQTRSAYPAGQLILDSNGNLQTVQAAGMSGATEPAWKSNSGDVTVDGTLKWSNSGPGRWQPNHVYKAGQFVIDPKGNIQTVQADGTSGATQPAWQTTVSESVPATTTTAAVAAGSNVSIAVASSSGSQVGQQLVIDTGANQEQFTVTAISDATHLTADKLSKNHAAGVAVVSTAAVTPDGSINWLNNGQSTWQKKTTYAVGQFIIDHNGNIEIAAATPLTPAPTTAGLSGDTPPKWSVAWGQKTTDGSVTWINSGLGKWQPSTAYVAGQFIYDRNGNLQVVQSPGPSGAVEPQWSTASGQLTIDGKVLWVAGSWSSVDLQGILSYSNAFAGAGNQFPLCNAADQQDLVNNGVQHFIDQMNAKISKADDLINLAFLTAQTDIYRYRQNVLGATAASKLATSPILANIATGDTAAVVSENLQTFLNSLPTTKAPTPFPPPAGGTAVATGIGGATVLRAAVLAPAVRRVAPLAARATTTAAAAPISRQLSSVSVSKVAGTDIVATTVGIKRPLTGEALSPTVFEPIIRGTTTAPATTSDVSEQQPIVGAQLNIRTLTVAERLAQSPPQEALFYSISNRLAFLQLLSTLDLTIEDLTILVDSAVPSATNPDPVESHTLAELRDPKQFSALLNKVQAVQVQQNSDEATVFSNGIRVLEQHSQLLRALEGRVQEYRDFVSFCSTALSSVQSDLQRVQTALKQLDNNLQQDRQNVAFTSQLLAEETLRVQTVNQKRLQTLQNSVQVVAYTRARTLQATSDTPTRQLVPGNVTSPVPACLQESVAIPAELREMVALLREAPVNWLPAVQALLNRLERPDLLYEVAVSTQTRAMLQLQLPQPASSADTETGVYAPVISNLYYANQQVFRGFTTQRSSLQIAPLANQSWQSLVSGLQNVAAVGDLISSSAVHAEVVNATARLMTQISSVATCLYTRVSAADPAFRLAWAEFLRGPGLSLQLRSLSVLPNWTQQEYVTRDQMQMLVDWLFQQIDTSNSAAVAFMSDLVRVCILLASHAPVDQIISSALTVRTKPIVGGIVALNLPSVRVASGMYVNLYSKGVLAAQAVVSDLDSQTVRVTVTNVYQPDVYIETTDVAHFTAQTPKALALRAFAK